ncbi:MAG: NADH-quinone oxidoreductase subunit K [Proteobacteria bacterium]|nr:NADH-quinone oxidoreductase subunit K [Pseudomonadota bacterium]
MTLLVACVVGVVYGVSLLLLLRGSLWQLLLGLALLSHGAHLLIFAGAGLVPGAPPLAPDGASAPAQGSADPLPQALVLTAIVIAFAVLAFALVLALRAGEATGTDELDAYGGEDG